MFSIDQQTTFAVYIYIYIYVHCPSAYCRYHPVRPRDQEEGDQIQHHDISYCRAEHGVQERIFTWISKNKEAKRLDCHAVLCASKEKAQTVAMVLSRTFHMAYKDWKNDNEKSARLKNGKLADGSSLSRSTPGRVSRNGSDVSHARSSDKSIETAMHNTTIASGSKDDDFFVVNNVVIEPNYNGNNNTESVMPEPWYRCVLFLCQCSEIVFATPKKCSTNRR